MYIIQLTTLCEQRMKPPGVTRTSRVNKIHGKSSFVLGFMFALALYTG